MASTGMWVDEHQYSQAPAGVGEWEPDEEGPTRCTLRCVACDHPLYRLRNEPPLYAVPIGMTVQTAGHNGFFQAAKAGRRSPSQRKHDAQKRPQLIWKPGNENPFGGSQSWRYLFIGDVPVQVIDPKRLLRVKCWQCGEITRVPAAGGLG